MAHGNEKPISQHRVSLKISVTPAEHKWLKKRNASAWVSAQVDKQMRIERNVRDNTVR